LLNEEMPAPVVSVRPKLYNVKDIQHLDGIPIEHNYEAIVNMLPAAAFVKDANSHFVFLNKACEDQWGMCLEELRGTDGSQFYPKEQLEWLLAKDHEVFLERRQIEFEASVWNAHLGENRIVRTIKNPCFDANGNPQYLVCVMFDITEQKRAEESAQSAKLRLDEAQRIAQIGNWSLDLNNGTLDWSAEMYRILEIDSTKSAPDYKVCLNLIHPEDREKVNFAYTDSINSRTAYTIEHRILLPSGRIKWVHERGESLYDEFGCPVCTRGTVQDITERILADQKLQLQHEIQMHMAEGVQITNASDEKILSTTSTFDRMFGYAENELVGQHVSILNSTSTASPAEISSSINKILRRNGYWKGEVLNRRKDGSEFLCWVVISTFDHHEYGKVWIAVHEDISERRRVELELIRSRELAYRDVLIREVHHRIKNNLQGITGILRRNAKRYSQLEPLLNDAISQVQSIAVIHGLQGRSGRAKVRLCELTIAIAKGIESLWEQEVDVQIPSDWQARTVSESEAVPIALILSELIGNAMKHGDFGHRTVVHFSGETQSSLVDVTIKNSGTLPMNLDLGDENGIGIGLQLVHTMMPPTGATLTLKQESDQVIATLKLGIPIVRIDDDQGQPTTS